MDAPLCTECLKRIILCPTCQKKFEEGKVSALEIQVARVLDGLNPNASFQHLVETEDSVIILTEKGKLGSIIGKGGENLQKLREVLGKQVKVLGVDEFEDLVESLVSPAEVKSINKIFANGEEKQKVVVRGGDKLRISAIDIAQILEKATGFAVSVVVD